MKLWVVAWHHPHGTDVFPLWCADDYEPSEDDAIDLIDDFVPRLERVDVHGPMDIPQQPHFSKGEQP